MSDLVVLCVKVPSEVARRFDAMAKPSRSAVLRELVESYVRGGPRQPASPELEVEVITTPLTPNLRPLSCPHPKPWVELATGHFCPTCRERIPE